MYVCVYVHIYRFNWRLIFSLIAYVVLRLQSVSFFTRYYYYYYFSVISYFVYIFLSSSSRNLSNSNSPGLSSWWLLVCVSVIHPAKVAYAWAVDDNDNDEDIPKSFSSSIRFVFIDATNVEEVIGEWRRNRLKIESTRWKRTCCAQQHKTP